MKNFLPLITLVSLLFISCDTNRPEPIPPVKSSSHQAQVLLESSDSASHQDKSFSADWSVTKNSLSGGKQEGVELVTLDNGKLQIVLIPTRGMGILEVTMGELRLGWDSPVKEVVHPSFIDLESRGGLGWLEGFNEWMVRCGLEFAGHPGTDEFLNNTGDKATLNLTLHGKIQNIPASNYEVIVDPDPPHRIRIRGTVYESFFYGPKLKLTTEISTIPGSSSFRISDELINEGGSIQEFQLIYHGNYGSSILEANATLYTAANSVTPMNDHAAKAIDHWNIYRGPTEGFIEEVYLIDPLADENSSSIALLVNAKSDLATSVRWNITELPYLTIWKNTASEQDGYVTGIEPATGYPFNRLVERKYGRVPKLAPGESRSFNLEFGIHSGTDEVLEIIDEVNDRQGSNSLQIISEPPVTK